MQVADLEDVLGVRLETDVFILGPLPTVVAHRHPFTLPSIDVLPAPAAF
jgi:hypothetical protein